jgi:hypothetical protein
MQTSLRNQNGNIAGFIIEFFNRIKRSAEPIQHPISWAISLQFGQKGRLRTKCLPRFPSLAPTI